eukprot:6078803-Lingulodinium_polyedra.AAC.1
MELVDHRAALRRLVDSLRIASDISSEACDSTAAASEAQRASPGQGRPLRAAGAPSQQQPESSEWPRLPEATAQPPLAGVQLESPAQHRHVRVPEQTMPALSGRHDALAVHGASHLAGLTAAAS